MPSSLTWFLSRALEYSSLPPVSVYGTVSRLIRLGAFLDSMTSVNPRSHKEFASHRSPGLPRRIYLPGLPRSLDCHVQSAAHLAFCTPPSLKHQPTGTGIFNLFPIVYAFRPRLRGRLTLGGRTFPRNPWDFGGQDSHLAYRYSCPHNHLYAVHGSFPLRFNPHTTLLYHAAGPGANDIRSFGIRFSPVHFRRKITRLVSYYALFK